MSNVDGPSWRIWTNPAGDGWVCTNCNTWVPNGHPHTCPMVSGVGSVTFPTYQIAPDVLERLISVLEKLEKLLREKAI